MQWRNTFWSAACCTAIVLCLCRPCRADDEIDRYVRHELEAQHIPGLSLAVVKAGHVVKAAGYGVENVEQGTPATPDTVYRVASLTKQFTASATMLLVQEGRVGLDDKISRFLAPVPAAWADITVRELLTHTAGLKDYINELHVGTCNGTSEEELVKGLGEAPLNFKPGTGQAYSNTNYLVLGLIVKKITGQSYDQFLAKRVFEPLGMSHTGKVDYAKVVPHRAAGYVFANGTLTNAPYLTPTLFDNADAGLVSSVSDLAKWDAALRAGKILTKASQEVMFSSAHLPDGGAVLYGLGWATRGTPGTRFVSHAGSFPGVSAYMVRYLDQDDVTVIVLINRSEAAASEIARHVATLYDPKIRPMHASSDAKADPAVTATIRTALAGIQTGTLQNDLFAKEMWTDAEREQTVAYLRRTFASYGALGTVSFLSVSQEGDKRQYFYAATFGDSDVIVDATINKDGKISAMGVQAE